MINKLVERFKKIQKKKQFQALSDMLREYEKENPLRIDEFDGARPLIWNCINFWDEGIFLPARLFYFESKNENLTYFQGPINVNSYQDVKNFLEENDRCGIISSYIDAGKESPARKFLDERYLFERCSGSFFEDYKFHLDKNLSKLIQRKIEYG